MTDGAPGRAPVSVVVPSRDRPEMLARCLASVRGALRPDDELVVVDSASRDAAAVARVAAEAGARLVRVDLPGVDRARNAGWTVTTHDLVLFTDDDVQVDPGWADAYARCFAEHPECSFATGRIGVPPDQVSEHEVAVKDDPEPAVLDRTSVGSLGHGASTALRRSALVAVGGWDEALGNGGRFRAAPELDLFDRLFASGRTGRYEPAARAWHDQWRTDGQLVVLNLRYGVGAGARLAKLVRTDRPRCRRVAREVLWDWGLASLLLHLRHHDLKRTVTCTVRMLGYLVGFLQAVVVPLQDGHFRPLPSPGQAGAGSDRQASSAA
ncbi:MAG: glycosyltransferase family 2 protein [Frankiales bacterium]|nr:glycosyltransferase family 2 protein [Frankiales bacterium]